MSVFAVSRVRLDSQGAVTDVSWGVVDTKSNHWVSPEVEAPMDQVIDAIRKGDQVVALFPHADGYLPGRPLVAVTDANGREAVALEGPSEPGRELHDMDQLNP